MTPYHRARIRASRFQLKELVWKVRDVDEIPPGFCRDIIHQPDDLRKYAFLFNESPVEKFVVFLLNAQNGITAIDEISSGTLSSSLVHPREVFRAAISGLAAAIIVGHNHPSGNPEPSAEDVEITRQLVESGKILGIPVRDHVIFAADGITSLAERGVI